MRIRSERGIALPVTIFMITLITLLLATGFTRIKAEGEITVNSGEVASALAVAHSGLESYFATLVINGCTQPVRPVDGDSVRINVTGGYAWVVARVVQRPADTLKSWLYIVKSTGYSVEPAISSSPRAQRTTAQFARWQPGWITQPHAWTAANGLSGAANGDADGEFKGDDQAVSGCDLSNISPLRVPSSEGPSDVSAYIFNGASPAVSQNGTGPSVAAATLIDWPSIIGGDLVPDYTTVQFGNWDYTVQMITGNATIGTAGDDYGTGLLIVTGDLTVQGGFFQWYGVILVGGRIIFGANDQRVDGYVVSGLNEQLGINVPPSVFGAIDNYTDIDFNSQYTRRGLTNLQGWAPIRNAWMDNWASY